MSLHLIEPISNNNSLTWPKKVTKACASCRRDKVRCDGSRPCGSCAKKGYAAEDCTDGCEPCRRARVRCEYGKPCRRCEEMKLECSDKAIAPARQAVTVPVAPRVSNRGGERAKLACFSCRRDNKKCDDQRPCSRCIARNEECIHVERGPKLVQLRCEGCRDGNKRCEESRPCRYCIQESRDCIAVSRKGKGHGTRVKVACANCRRDKIRCNGDRPCYACVKKEFKCDERACQACSRDGKTVDCSHGKPQDGGLDDKEGDLTSRGETIASKTEALQAIQPTYGQTYNPHERPQWFPYVADHQSQYMNPTYPRIMAQPQHLCPPQLSSGSQFSNVPYTMTQSMQSRYPETNYFESHRYYHTSDYNNRPYMPSYPGGSNSLR